MLNNAGNICILDFAGNMDEPGYWADYDGKAVVFGGNLGEYKSWKISPCPTEDELWAALDFYDKKGCFPNEEKPNPYEVGTPLFDWNE